MYARILVSAADVFISRFRMRSSLRSKEKQVRSLLDAVCPEYEFEGILGSPLVQGYRNKMEFSFGDEVKDGPMSLGMHKARQFL